MSKSPAVYGIIGNPVEHSLSPLMHNTAFQELGVNAVYKLFPLEENELEGFFADIQKKDSPICGLNVTVPYKEAVLQYVDSLHPFAQKVMAVNTITVLKDRSLQGFNTDGPGFLSHLTELKFKTNDKRVAILGAGGSARAIISALCLISDRPESIRIYSRHQERVDALIQDLGTRMDVGIVKSVPIVDDLNIELCDLLINTTPVGLKNEDACLIDPEVFHPDMLVYDLIYNPSETHLLKIAKQGGAQTSNGLGMLFYQGILAFQHWAGGELDKKIKVKIRQLLEQRVAA